MKNLFYPYLWILVLIANQGFAQNLTIQNINVIDVEHGIVHKGQDVVIKNGLIDEINANESIRLGEEYLDGTGKYLSPGFIDSHVHVAMGTVSLKIEGSKPILVLNPDEDLTRLTCDLLLKNGITTARDPGGLTEITTGTRDLISRGEMKGPELFVAGSVIDTVQFRNLTSVVKTPNDIRAEVLRQKEDGVDMVKLYTSLTPEMLKAGIDEAHANGIMVTAHLHTTSWTQAAELGIDNIVHIIPGNDECIDSSRKEEYRQAVGTKAFYKWFELVDLESEEVKHMIRVLRKNKVAIDPTLMPFHAAFYGNTGEYQSNPALEHMPSKVINNWKTTFNFNLGWNENDYRLAQAAWPKVQKFTKMLFDEGILLTAGTDANNPWTVPGDSFHRELELLHACGLTNADVLKIGTLNGAMIIRKEDKIGSIALGKEADLVVLSANPLEDISATRSIDLVINNGIIVK